MFRLNLDKILRLMFDFKIYTFTELIEKTHFSRIMIGRLKRGERVHFKTVVRLANFFCVDFTELILKDDTK